MCKSKIVSRSVLLTACGIISCFCLSAFAQTQSKVEMKTQEQMKATEHVTARDMLELKDRIHKDANIPLKDLSAYTSQFRIYLDHNGDPAVLSQITKDAAKADCMGECLGQVFHSTNQALEKGLTNDQVQAVVSQAITEQVGVKKASPQKWSEKQFAEALKKSINARVQEQQRQPAAEKVMPMHKAAPEHKAPKRGGGGY